MPMFNHLLINLYEIKVYLNHSVFFFQLRLKLNADSKDCPSNVDPQLRQWLLDRASQPPSLKEIIVFKIRKILDQDLHKAVTQLPLPSRVKDMILLRNILSVSF